MNFDQIVEYAKQGGRLAQDKQWILADALATLTDTEISQVAVDSGRNESTLYQYARAAQRWSAVDRVEGVSFSAHRVALSWVQPRELLIGLKHQHGSPTVRQVREAMGLGGHIALELFRKGISKLDRQVSAAALAHIRDQISNYLIELGGTPDPEPEDSGREVQPPPVELPANKSKGTWVPPVRTDDVAGL